MTSPGVPGTPWGTPGLPLVPKAPEIPGVAQALELSEALGAARRWIADRHNWARVAWFGSGVFLMLAGIGMIAGKSAGTKVVKVVDKVI